jgi:hypothetical protein
VFSFRFATSFAHASAHILFLDTRSTGEAGATAPLFAGLAVAPLFAGLAEG